MQNHAPLSQAQALFEESRETDDADLPDIWRSEPGDGETGAGAGAAEEPAVSGFVGPDDIPELTPELATRRSAATSYGDLAAIIRLQSTEIERLAQENDRLAVHLDAVTQFHANEQRQRRSLEQQIRELSARPEAPAPTPAVDLDDIRRAARDSMSAEIKPVLMSILDLLESALLRNAETPAAQPQQPVGLGAQVVEEFRQLPDILTRPLEELTAPVGDTAPAPAVAAGHPAPMPTREPRAARQPASEHKARAEGRSTVLPGVFAWTNLFSC